MLIVGELINASRKSIAAAIKDRDADTIKKVAKDQHEAGADFIDANAGVFVDEEAECLAWLVETIQSAVDAPCCIDSPSPKAIEAAMKVHKGAPMLNSISLEKDRYEAMLPLVSGTGCKVIALCMSDKGMPESVEDRVSTAEELVNKLVQNNMAMDDIYVDPLVQPVSTNDSYGINFLNAVEAIMEKFPEAHTICGLSNISFGLPKRKLINRVFIAMGIAKGLDSAVADPLDKQLMANMIIAETLAGNDQYCGNYLGAFRKGALEF